MSVVAAQAKTQTFRATAAEIRELDRWLEQVGTDWAVPEPALFRARVCISELAANVWEHGDIARTGCDQIVITLWNRASAVEIEFVDGGVAFNPIDAPSPSPVDTDDDGASGGRGLRVLRSYASQMDYRRDRGRNVVRFRVSAI
jgi:anti-sigma regulatory factor (Ser/Thr protein kinase)